jgi:hypothetical protein
MLDLRLDTAGGEAYVTSGTIVWVSAAFKKGNYPETRSVGLSSGHTIYMLNTPENIARLRESKIGEMIPVAPPSRDKKRRRAGGRAKEATT